MNHLLYISALEHVMKFKICSCVLLEFINSQVRFGRESSVGGEFALHADICTLGSGFLATDYMSFLQNPGTRGQNMSPNRLSNIYKSLV